MALANTVVGLTDTTIFTASGTDGNAGVSIVLYNSHSSAVEVTANARPGGEAVGLANTLFKKSIPAGDSFVFESKLLLANTDVVSAKADVDAVVAATLSQLEL